MTDQFSVVDWRRFHADPDPNFHIYADPDWHQNNADPHTDPTPGFTLVGKSEKSGFFLLLVKAMPIYNV
jgi:hypothetical protein